MSLDPNVATHSVLTGFGYNSDYRTSNWVHEAWTDKKEREAYARSVGGSNMKVIAVHNGHFMEDSAAVSSFLSDLASQP